MKGLRSMRTRDAMLGNWPIMIDVKIQYKRLDSG